MYANNETGELQPIAELATIAHEHGALLHTDAAQAAGKIPVNIAKLDIDLLTIVGHKMSAPRTLARSPFVRVYASIHLSWRRPGTWPSGRHREHRTGRCARRCSARIAAVELTDEGNRLGGLLVRTLSSDSARVSASVTGGRSADPVDGSAHELYRAGENLPYGHLLKWVELGRRNAAVRHDTGRLLPCSSD